MIATYKEKFFLCLKNRTCTVLSKSENRPVWFKVTNYGTSSPEARRALSLWKHVVCIRRFFQYSPRIATGPVSREGKRAGERERESYISRVSRGYFFLRKGNQRDRARERAISRVLHGALFLAKRRERERLRESLGRDSLVMCVCGMRAKSFHVRQDEKSSPREMVEGNGEAQ